MDQIDYSDPLNRNSEEVVANGATGLPGSEISYRIVPKEPARARRWFLPCSAVAGIMVLSACLGAVCLTTAFVSAAKATVECLALADSFMTAMAAGDTGEAYALFSADVQQEMTTEQLQSMLDGPFSVLYEGFEELGIDGFYVNVNNTVGLGMELTGPVYYQDGTVGSFEATFQRSAGDWRLYYIEVFVPSGRFSHLLDQFKKYIPCFFEGGFVTTIIHDDGMKLKG